MCSVFKHPLKGLILGSLWHSIPSVKRVIQKKVLNELSKQMLLGKVLPKTKVMLDVFDGKVVFREPRKEEV